MAYYLGKGQFFRFNQLGLSFPAFEQASAVASIQRVW